MNALGSRPPAVRRFQAVYTALTLNFLVPGLLYAVAPGFAIQQFELIGRMLGGGPYPFAAGETGHVWRVLAAANVLTLSFMCALLQWDLRRFFPVLVPLLFLKASSALLYLWVFLAVSRYPAFLAVFLFDVVAAGAMVYFARSAAAALEEPC
ncbi:MAG: hypothetical protein HY554_13750 [Elusimicrobia bacterium]|nr:hypothetical protein [Elusimicrobiota bacterium]